MLDKKIWWLTWARLQERFVCVQGASRGQGAVRGKDTEKVEFPSGPPPATPGEQCGEKTKEGVRNKWGGLVGKKH